MIGGKEMLRHVVDAADKCAFYLNRNSHKSKIRVSYAILCPKGDPLREKYSTRAMVIEGSEEDVLSRYVVLADRMAADYVVRITADCPLLPPDLITRHIVKALANEYAYFSNVDENYRTAIDGYDVEVIQALALSWANENAKEPRDREHVTTILRSPTFKEQFSWGVTVGNINQSHMKLSVDNPTDLERVRVEYSRVFKILEMARSALGSNHVHKV
jgi:spore coat polysaccharide biosynthesis protein SpsF (cytidylyltransferase family)